VSQKTRVWNRNQAPRFKINLNIFCECSIIHVLNALRSTFPQKTWYGTLRKLWGNGLEPWEKVVQPWEKSGGTVRRALHVYETQYCGCLTVLFQIIFGYHQKNHSVYHGSYAWFLAILPGSYGTSRRGPVTYETSPQEPWGIVCIPYTSIYGDHYRYTVYHITILSIGFINPFLLILNPPPNTKHGR